MDAGSSSSTATDDDDDDDDVAVVACKSLRFIPPPLSVFSRSRPHKIHLDLDLAVLCAAAVFGDYSNYLTCVIASSVISRRTPLFLPSPSRAVPRSGQWSNRNPRPHSRQLGANGNGLVNTRGDRLPTPNLYILGPLCCRCCYGCCCFLFYFSFS